MLAAREGEPFHLGNGWFSCWSDAFGPVTYRHGLPMIAAREPIGPLAFAGLRGATNPHSAHYDAAPGVAIADDLAERLLAESGAASVRFDYLRDDAVLFAAAARWPRARIAPHAVSPVADCRVGYDAWFAARSKRIRQRLRRDGREALCEHKMRREFRTDDPVPSGLFDAMLAVERSGWKGRGGTAIADNPAERSFYTALVQRAAAAGMLRIALLWDGERLAAFEFGVVGGRRLFLLKVGYDERYADLSVGYVLAAEHIRQCCHDPAVDWYDKMGNGMSPAEYKLRFADQCDTLYRVTVYAADWRGWLLHARDVLRARAKTWRDRLRARKA